MSRKPTKSFLAGFDRLFDSSHGRAVFPRAMKRELQFEDHIPYVSLQADDITVLTRGNELMQCVRVEGLNSMTASDDQIEALKSRIATIVTQAGPQFTFYVHEISRPFKPDLAGIENGGFAEELDRRWRDALTSRGLRDRTLTISVLNRPSAVERSVRGLAHVRAWAWAIRGETHHGVRDDGRNARVTLLAEVVAVLCSGLSEMQPRVLSGQSGELIGFLEAIGTGVELPCFRSKDLAVLARSICNYRATFNGTTIRLTGGRLEDRVGKIFSIKNYPSETFAGMFDEMRLPLDMVVTHSFTPISADEANEKFRRMIHQKASVNDAGRSQQAEMEEGRDRVTSGLETLGHHHMTIALYANTDDVLATAVAEIRSIAQSTGTTMITEAFAGPGHYFAQWPGNAAYRSRAGLITNHSFAGMASLHRAPTGYVGKELPWQSPITVFSTPERSAVQFSFHPRGKAASEAEPPAGHTLIFGPTGGGKSVLIALLAAQAQRVNARVFAFDYRRGLEWQIKTLGGSYSAISADQPTGLNPLFAETDAGGRSWLSDWLAALLRREDKPFSPTQSHALHRSVIQNADAPEHLRNWQEFGSLFRSLDDGGDLEQRVREWAPGGRYGWVFGGNEKDSFALDKSIMGFDLTAVLDSDQEKERTAILGYLFQRLERKLQDRRPTIIVVDEAWKALATTYFAEKLQNWLVTARKLNAVVVMVTQFPSQLAASAAGNSMLQAVQTQILLCNDRAKPEHYEILSLNPREQQTVLSSVKGGRLALVRNAAGSVVVDLDLTSLGGCLTLLGGGATVGKVIGDAMQTNPEAWRTLL